MKTTKTDPASRTPNRLRHAATLATALATTLAAGLYANPLAAQPVASPKTDAATATRAAPTGQAQASSPAQAQAASATHGVVRSTVTPARSEPADASTLVARQQALYPSTRFGSIHPTAWPGVFEVAMGANLAYVDATGRYFLFGHLYTCASSAT